MPDQSTPGDRTPAQRQADHASLARLSETLVPAIVAKLTGTGLGEVEVREGDWRIRVRRPLGAAGAVSSRRDRPRLSAVGSHPSAAHAPARVPAPAVPADPRRALATSPAVGVFRPGVAIGSRVRAGDRIAVVDLLGIPQDVTAPIDGTLVDVFVQAGEAVEYGEEIAAIEAEAAPEPGDGAGSGEG
jgi:acetyl-CoA carboxylase biotin carboxyl carrier protein